ncbi:diguanylate cyclase [Acidithiobacillus caldus]|nr:diguanylate cyclase [Acidithiobacillus caldus]MBU2770439.1 diguanylate cyclase [Acidithiobacillus caldus]MBU2789423.1 diguanylate cyclase [Acidithiobacillus caldus]MBU2822301.1 diguanylate cyclase [Acidithiobacillus caldus]
MRTDGTPSEGSDYISALMNLGGLDVLRICPSPHVILNKRRIIFLNTAAMALLDGSEAEEFLHKDIIEFVHPLDQELVLYRFSALTESHPQNAPTLIRLRTRTGAIRAVVVSSATTRVNGLRIDLASGTEVTELLKMDAALKASEENFQRLFENMHDVFYRTNERQELVMVGPGSMRMLGYTVEEVLGRPAADFYLVPEERSLVVEAIQKHGEIRDHPARLRHKDGRVVHVAITSRALKGAGGELLGVEGIFRDVTAEVEAKAALTRLATWDDLTDTLNRRAFLEQTGKYIRHLRRYPEESLLVIVDLDHFKAVNDRFGHLAGDKVLRTTAEIIRDVLRSTDLFGRLGGDEFAIVFRKCCPEEGYDILGRILSRICGTEVALSGREHVCLSVSLGATPLLAEDQPTALALARADRALYWAKAQGRGRCAFAPIDGEPFLPSYP